MDTKVDKTPRQLAREYFNGQLGFAEYRELRRRVIDGITNPDVTRPAARSVAPQEPESREPAAPHVPVQPPSQKTGAAVWLFAGAGVIVAGLVIGWLLLSGGHGKPPVSESSSGQPVATTAAESPVPVPSLLENFLAANDWKYEALAALTLSWSELQARDQQAIQDSEAFRVFSERLRERVLEQQALQGIDKSAAKREQDLLSLGQQMGVPGLEPASPPVTAQEATPPPVAKQGPVTGKSGPAESAQPVSPAPVAPRAAPTAAVAETPKTGAQTGTGESGRARPAASGKAGEQKASPAVETAHREQAAAVTAPAVNRAGETAVAAATAVASHPATGDACRAALANTRRPYCHDRMKDGSEGPLMIVLPAGRFRMGSTREASEQPVHMVTIAHPFAISAYEVSVAEYRRFCHATAQHCMFPWPGDHDPAVDISWKDAQSYVHWLSGATGATYRLPTEAEWEYAARGRSNAEYPVGDGTTLLPTDARFNATSPVPVDDRLVNVNVFHLRHIVGNVREWVQDAWYDNYQGAPTDGRARTGSGSMRRVVRGGAYDDSEGKLRSAAREGINADTRDRKTGLRLVREITE